MKKVGRGSYNLKNVYIKEKAVFAGLDEEKGKMGKYIDKIIDDYYNEMSSYEESEQKMLHDCIIRCLEKANLGENDIDCYLGGDLNNQITATTFANIDLNYPMLGLFSACASIVEGLILGGILIDTRSFNNVIVGSSSHYGTSVRQFRNPFEYAAQTRPTLTKTVTAAGACILSKDESNIMIKEFTIGRIIDSNQYDASDMGRAMAGACVDTFLRHIKAFHHEMDYYDLIISGDLSKYGKDVFIKSLEELGFHNFKNYEDSGMLAYNEDFLKEHPGGSGCGCITVGVLGYVVSLLKEKKLNKVLILGTGALYNPVSVAQNKSIPSICHAVSLERVIK